MSTPPVTPASGMSAVPPNMPPNPQTTPPPPTNPVSATVDTMLPPPTVAVKPSNLGISFYEAAAFLLVWSMCVTIEGALRFNSLEPSVRWGFTPDGAANRIALLLGGLFEVFFGLLGLFLAVYTLLFRRYNGALVRAALAIQVILGIYVFLAFVVVDPAYRADNLGPVFEFLNGAEISRGLARWLITLGIFTSAHFCLALQGGQFVFFARMIALAEGEDFFKMRSAHKSRAVAWNANMALAGFWTFVTGCTIAANTPDETMFMFPPHVGTNAGLTIFVGLIMLAIGATGMALAMSPPADLSWYYAACGVVYLFMYLNFTIVQTGLIEGGGAQAIGMHTGLVTFVSLLGPYFLICSTRKEE